MPEAVNLKQTGREVERLVEILSRGMTSSIFDVWFFLMRVLVLVPGFQFAQLLRNVIVKARRRHVLPPASKAASPTLGPTDVSIDGIPWKAMDLQPMSTPTMGQSQSIGSDVMPRQSDESPVDLGPSSQVDFLYAEHLFSDNGRANNGGAEASDYVFVGEGDGKGSGR